MNVFTVHDVAKAMHKSVPYASLMLSKNKQVRRLFRGTYYTIDADIYEIVSNIVYPSYVSLSAALQYYSLINQNIIRYSIITTKRHKPLELGRNIVEFITLGKGRVFGYYSKDGAYVATIEKMFVDCLYFGIPPLDQVRESFAEALRDYDVNVARMKEYGLMMKSKSLINKLGFLLEDSGKTADDLLKHTYRSKYVGSGSNRNKKWMVLYD
jgi:predicted transcriptional regulator of viral defense system